MQLPVGIGALAGGLKIIQERGKTEIDNSTHFPHSVYRTNGGSPRFLNKPQPPGIDPAGLALLASPADELALRAGLLARASSLGHPVFPAAAVTGISLLSGGSF